MQTNGAEPIRILLVEDEPGDVELTLHALKTSRVSNEISVVRDGAEALDYLYQKNGFENAPKPDLILLDLNLPKIDGREVLAKVKTDDQLKKIPVIVLTTSEEDRDIIDSYQLHANCYLSKPVDVKQFVSVIRMIDHFWLTIVKLP